MGSNRREIGESAEMNIEFEITLRCNAKCPSCSRHCPYLDYGDDSDVGLGQVARFIMELKSYSVDHTRVDMIHVMGGEPTLHPFFEQIVIALQERLLQPGHIRRLQVVTNGIIPVDPKLEVPTSISRPEEKGPDHRCMLVAPFDTGQKFKECPVPEDCGVSFGAYGWWPCGAGGAICRLFGLNQYRRDTIPDDEYQFPDKNAMCSYCQAKAAKYMFVKDFGDIRSISFWNAMKDFDKSKLEKY